MLCYWNRWRALNVKTGSGSGIPRRGCGSVDRKFARATRAGLSSAIPPQETVAMLPASDLPEIIGNVVALNLDAQTTSNAGGVQAVQWSLPG